MDFELEKFKTEIDLRAYAAGQGYELDRKESYAGSAVMRNPHADKIIIKRDADGHWVYFSVRDDADNGTIIDFVKRRLGISLGAARKELRAFMGLPASNLPPYPPLSKVVKDRLRIERAWARMQAPLQNPYLENGRGIPRAILEGGRFVGRMRIDARGNTAFPHFDEDGLSGFELKNLGYTSFAAGGTKGLWTGNFEASDNRLVFCESAIDALSHAALFPGPHNRYASIGGKPTPLQRELIRSTSALMPLASSVVAAMDSDAGGQEMAEIVRAAVKLTGRTDLSFETHFPEGGPKDWNDVLRQRPLASPTRSGEPYVL